MMRKGAGRGTGKGYKNLRSFPRDASIHSQSAKGIKTAQNIKGELKVRIKALSKFNAPAFKEEKTMLQKQLPDFVNKKVLTEQQINLLKRRLNDGKLTQEQIFGESFDKKFILTPTQTKKGFDWLDNLRKTPKGIERLNNPFGYREEAILDNFDRIELTKFYDNANFTQAQRGMHNYTPLWTVFGKDGSTFQYHLDSSYKFSIL